MLARHRSAHRAIFFEELRIVVDALRRDGMLFPSGRTPYASSVHGVNTRTEPIISVQMAAWRIEGAFSLKTSPYATDKASLKAQACHAAGGWADCRFAALQFWNSAP